MYQLPVDENPEITQHFGDNVPWYPNFGNMGHPGIDFACKVGSPVIAVNNAKVVEATEQEDGWGYHIILDDGKYRFLYAHLNAILVDKGEIVKRGEQIGCSGETGRCTGPHLHFGVRSKKSPLGKKGKFFDPVRLFFRNNDILVSEIDRIRKELAQIKKCNYKERDMKIHLRYIERIVASLTQGKF